MPSPVNERLWHIPFNRVETLAEQLIAGREDVYFGYEFAIQGGNLPQDVIDYYISLVCDPEALRGSLGFYRGLDATLAQNAERAKTPLSMPVLAIGGERSYGPAVGQAMESLAGDVQGVVIPGAGHWASEEAPDEVGAALAAFLAPTGPGSPWPPDVVETPPLAGSPTRPQADIEQSGGSYFDSG